jgi:hypothetical protein
VRSGPTESPGEVRGFRDQPGPATAPGPAVLLEQIADDILGGGRREEPAKEPDDQVDERIGPGHSTFRT